MFVETILVAFVSALSVGKSRAFLPWDGFVQVIGQLPAAPRRGYPAIGMGLLSQKGGRLERGCSLLFSASVMDTPHYLGLTAR